ncbi:HAD-IIA family hydrolase [Thermomicrobium sp.]
MRALDFDAWLLDLDGVVYVGDQLLPGVAEALATLRATGKHLRFLTNDPRPTREQLAERLRRLGIDVAVEELVTCGWATARLLPQLGIGTAYVVGSAGLAEELARVGLTVVDEGVPDAVVVGADERLDFRTVVKGSLLVQRGARFIATNADASYPMPLGTVPATGAVVCAIRLATGQRPLVVGKPEPLMFQLALETLPASATVLVVGDRVDSDVLGAHRAGLPAVLLAREEPDFPARDLRRPERVVASLAELVTASPEIPLRPFEDVRWPERVVAGVILVVLDETLETVALVPVAGSWMLPWVALEPLESFAEAAQRLLARMLPSQPVSLTFLPELVDGTLLVRNGDGALVQLAGPVAVGRSAGSMLAGGAEWREVACARQVLPADQARVLELALGALG